MLELRIKKDELLKGVSQTQSVAEKRSSMPILSNVLLEVGTDELSITATDLEVTFRGSYEAQVENQGRLTVPARKFYEIVRVLADETIHLKEMENYGLVLTGARSTYQLNGLSPDDYPPPPDLSEAGFIDLPSEILVDMIDKTISSVAVEETRYNLAGVYVEKGELDGKPVLRMVSTDGHRLSLMERSLDGLAGLKLDKGVIISKKAMNEIRKLSEEEETLKLGFGGNSAMIKGERMYLVMRLLEGRFPDYNLVIPKNNDKVFQVGRKDFQDVLKRISIMSTDDFKGVKFSLSPKELTLSVVNPDLGRAEESLPVEYEGDEVEIGFNPRYFIESLASLKSDAISVALKDSGNPCLVTASEDVGFRGVIMPMKI